MIMFAYEEGLHLISISPSDVKELIKDPEVDERLKTILNHYNNHTAKESSLYFNYFNRFVKIYPQDFQEVAYCYINTKTECLQMKTSSFSTTSSIQSTILLAENNNDAAIYDSIGRFYLQSHKLKSIRISHVKQAGGGDTTAASYKEIHKQKDKFCLCILDSDKKTPYHSIGSTAKKVQDFNKKHGMTNLRCVSYVNEDIHELENILPEKFYVLKYGPDVNKKEIFPRLKNINEETLRFFDFKMGIKCRKLHENDMFSVYWKSVFRITFIECSKEFQDKSCDSANFINGYGDKILEDFMQHGIEANHYDMVNDSFNYLKEEWTTTGSIIASMCCGDTPKKAI